MSKEDRVGALWLSQSTSPRAPFAKGVLEIDGQKVPVVMWSNKWKAEDLESTDSSVRAAAHKKPDYYLERDQPRETPEPPRQHRETPERARAAATVDDFTDDIPF